jgi:flagellar basal-body rod protein FlgC
MKKLLLFILLCGHSLAVAQTLEDAMKINTSGVLAQRLRMTVVAENLANLMTLKDEETGLPYQKKYVVLQTGGMHGVQVKSIERSTEPFGRYFDPAVPQADEDGYFYLPNTNMPNEMIVLKHSESMFDANINAFKLSKAMYQTAVDLLK